MNAEEGSSALNKKDEDLTNSSLRDSYLVRGQ